MSGFGKNRFSPAVGSGGGGAGEANTASNIGAGTGVFASKSGVDLRFKTIIGQGGITVTSDADEIFISSSAATGAVGDFLPRDGSLPMIGDLPMSGNNIVNVGEINGIRHYGTSSTDPVSPPPGAGDEYYNTTINEKMVYDESRMTWLSTNSMEIQAGRRGNTGAGSYYRIINGLAMNAAGTIGIPVPKGELVYLGWARTDSDPAILQVLSGSTIIAELSSSAAGFICNENISGSFGKGLLTFRNSSSGSATTNVSIFASFKKRG